jgi:hypothetical protein
MPPVGPVPDNVLIAALTEAIRSAGAGRITREADPDLVGICAEHLPDRLPLAGFQVARTV